MNRSGAAPKGGFSYIEVIAALALTAVVVLEVAPRLFESISDSKVNQAVAVVKSLQNAVTRYGGDLGTLYPLSTAGVATPNGRGGPPSKDYRGTMSDALLLSKTAPPASSEAGLWRKFGGPYTLPWRGTPPVGTNMSLVSVPSAAGSPTNNNPNFSLTGAPNTGLPAGSQLVYASFEGVDRREFDKLDSMLDPGIGASLDRKSVLGKVKWDPVTNVLLVYIAHR